MVKRVVQTGLTDAFEGRRFDDGWFKNPTALNEVSLGGLAGTLLLDGRGHL